MIDRKGNKILLRCEDGGFVLIEDKTDQWSILDIRSDADISEIIQDVEILASKRSKGVFHYTTLPEEFEMFKKMGYRSLEGAVAMFPLSESGDKLIQEHWRIVNGDRM